MGNVRTLKANHKGAKLGEAEPLRHMALEHAALAVTCPYTFAGNDQHQARTA